MKYNLELVRQCDSTTFKLWPREVVSGNLEKMNQEHQ